jgi:hypothetical protein
MGSRGSKQLEAALLPQQLMIATATKVASLAPLSRYTSRAGTAKSNKDIRYVD